MPNHSPKDPLQAGTADASVHALDFERAEQPSNAAPTCAQCATLITDRYFTLGSHLLCEACHLTFQQAKAPGNAASRFLGAAGLGALAAAVGCALWMIVTQLTGYEIGLIAIAVGYIVGLAVQFGARRVGGLVYQLLAVFLTYSAIVMTYVPAIAGQLNASEDFQHGLEAGASETESADPAEGRAEGEEPAARMSNPDDRAMAAWISAIPLAYMLPFLMGFENAIGILIIGFALWQAYRMNARSKLELQGPFRLQLRDTAGG